MSYRIGHTSKEGCTGDMVDGIDLLQIQFVRKMIKLVFTHSAYLIKKFNNGTMAQIQCISLQVLTGRIFCIKCKVSRYHIVIYD